MKMKLRGKGLRSGMPSRRPGWACLLALHDIDSLRIEPICHGKVKMVSPVPAGAEHEVSAIGIPAGILVVSMVFIRSGDFPDAPAVGVDRKDFESAVLHSRISDPIEL